MIDSKAVVQEVQDQLQAIVHRGHDQVRSHRGLAFAVVAVDAGRALVELDVGDHRQRHAATAAAQRHP